MPIDPSAIIAPTARIDPNAIIGPGVVIGDFCVIEHDTIIGGGTRLEPYVFVKAWTTLGEFNQISAGTVLGSDPLDKGFTGARSYLKIGSHNIIREHFTISRGTAPESETIVGDRNYIMTSGHIAHNCKIGDDIVIASCSLVSGYVEIENGAFISGGVAIHQFSKIGAFAMIAGMTRVNKDAPPYFKYAGLYIEPYGINSVGLRRAGFTREEMHALKEAYRILYRSDLKLAEALESIEAEVPTPHTKHLVEFVRSSKRGICRE